MTNKLIFSLITLLFFIGCGENSQNGNVIEESNSYGTITIVDTIKIEYKVEASETAKLENDIINFEFSPKPGDLKYIVNDQEITEKKYSIPINDLGDKLSIFVIPTATSVQGDKNLQINIYSKTIDDLIVDGKITSQFTTTANFKYNIPWPIWQTILAWIGFIIAILFVIIIVIRFKKVKLQRGTIEFNDNSIRFDTSCTKLVIGSKETIQKPTFMESLFGEKYDYRNCGIDVFGFVIEPKLSGKRKYHSILILNKCSVQDGDCDLRSDLTIKIVSDEPIESGKDKKNIFALTYDGVTKED